MSRPPLPSLRIAIAAAILAWVLFIGAMIVAVLK
jgi:hypothetical protein